MKPRPLHSLDALQLVISALRPSSLARGRTLRLAAEAMAFEFVSDPVLLRRVLINLAKNALEATRQGDIVTFSAVRDRQGVMFSVHNPSVMPDDVQHQVFQRSFSTKGAGRGLGTYSIKLLTTAYLGGKVAFVSTAESGTTFTIRLPIEPTPPA